MVESYKNNDNPSLKDTDSQLEESKGPLGNQMKKNDSNDAAANLEKSDAAAD